MSHKFDYVTEPGSPGAMKRLSPLEKQNLIHQRNLNLGLEMVREALIALGQFDSLEELVADGFLPESAEIVDLIAADRHPDNGFCECPPHPIDPNGDKQIRYISSYVEQRRFLDPTTGQQRSLWYCIACGHRNISTQVPNDLTTTMQEARLKFPGERQGADLDILPKKPNA